LNPLVHPVYLFPCNNYSWSIHFCCYSSVSVTKYDIIRSHSLPLIPKYSNFASNLSCFTQLNAFVRSQNSPQTNGLLSRFVKMLFVNLTPYNSCFAIPRSLPKCYSLEIVHFCVLLVRLPSKLLSNTNHTLHSFF
jgi:hypothetical protein